MYNARPRLGVDIVHPDDANKPTAAELAPWVRPPQPKCYTCSGVGSVYGARGLFRHCPCRIPAEAPERVREHLRSHLYELF